MIGAKKPGLSQVAKKEERLAILMLLPSFLVIIVIAIYPLFTVFRDSLTNKIFASKEPVEFVGLENYVQLLSVTIKELPPVIDEESGQYRQPEDVRAFRVHFFLLSWVCLTSFYRHYL